LESKSLCSYTTKQEPYKIIQYEHLIQLYALEF